MDKRSLAAGALLGIVATLGAWNWSEYQEQRVRALAQPILSVPQSAPALAQPWLPELAPKLTDQLRLQDVNGGALSLKSFLGRPIFINFWDPSCPPCVTEMRSIDNLYRELKDKGVVFLVVTSDVDPALLRSFVARNRLVVPMAIAHNATATLKSLGGLPVPATLIVDRQGVVIFRYAGPANWDSESVRSFLLAQR